ncbi:MAG: glycosyltransferase family 39 protein, partial [Bacillota bacterium]|nr:glycosyltransferase family 39 protein [Bacillota bacterium]
ALFLAVTPVFVADSRNNTVDNFLVMVLLFACWVLSIAAEKGRLKYLTWSMALVGIGFNVKMLQAYMIIPAVYITYLLTTAASFKKRILHLAAGTVVLVAVSLSWALIVDAVPAGSRPYVDSSTNNTEMELIVGHNGTERLNFGTSTDGRGGGGFGGGFGGGMQFPGQRGNRNGSGQNQGFSGGGQGGFGMGMPGGGAAPMGFGGSLQGSFGAQTPAGITRLFSRNILSDQIVWFIPLAVLGFIAAAIREKLLFRMNTRKKQVLTLLFMWFLPEFIYFSFNNGLFHSYYLTMLAPPIAGLAGIGVAVMWQFYKEGGWKAWFLPISLMANGAMDLLMISYFTDYSSTIDILRTLVIILCFTASIVLAVLNLTRKLTTCESSEGIKSDRTINVKRALLSLALAGVIVTPFAGSAAALTTSVNSSMPAAGLELMSNSSGQGQRMNNNFPGNGQEGSNSAMTDFLLKNKTAKQKYLLVVFNSNSASNIIINTGEAVMSIGGFMGNVDAISLDEFKQLVKNGEVRYVMAGGMGGAGRGSNSAIMSWVEQNGTLVSYGENNSGNSSSSTGNQRGSFNRGGASGQLYDLINLTDTPLK